MSFINPYLPNNYNVYGQQYQQPVPPQTQNFSMPTIRAEIVQINGDEDEAKKFPVPTGGTQMMINKTEDKIFIKTVYANNQSNLDVYVKQAPAPPQPQPNFDSFVTREELERRLAELSTSATPKKKKEETENEYVSEIR